MTALHQRLYRPRTVAISLAMLLATWLTGLAGCTRVTGAEPSATEPTTNGVTGPRLGTFMFSGSDEVRDHPIRVWYIAPKGDVATAEILIVIPGAQRNADDYRSDWVPLVRDRNVLVLVPEFNEDDFPHSSYNLGNMVDENGDPRPTERWTFTVIEALFDHVIAELHSQAEDYAIFGHSAGAQFVHRFMEFAPHNRARTAVAANAGWYTVPDDSEDFPYGFDEIPQREEDIGPAFASNLIVLLGADDIDSADDLLRQTDEAEEQGDNRLERGVNFYMAAREVAADRSLPFRWQLRVVPGIGHSHTEMAEAAAPLLVGNRS